MATLNIQKVHTRQLTGVRLVMGTIGFDSSYPTGGEAIDLPLNEVNGMLIENKAGYSFEYDRTNKKIKAYQYNYPGAAAGPATEVPNATDLSTITGVAFIAWGW